MPSASRSGPRTRSSATSPLVLAAVAVLLVGLVVVVFALTRSADPTGDEGSGSPAAVPSVSSGTVAPPGSDGSTPSGRSTPDSSLTRVAESALPDEAVTTLALIRAGGPFPYEEDGGTFGNRERILPRQPSGYYREYTVSTPGESDRGPRRIVGGADGDLYWTTDHYASFRQIEEGR
ncbi:MAG TPA: ribonuclease domain-containing protein [Ornithinibacter sp.]|jgi:ribonuclease T1|nr:ribonuclease domain-containing protein [Ornithinibacter sp.]